MQIRPKIKTGGRGGLQQLHELVPFFAAPARLHRRGTRTDLAEAIAFAAEGKMRAHFHKSRLANLDDRIRRPQGRQSRRPIVIDL